MDFLDDLWEESNETKGCFSFALKAIQNEAILASTHQLNHHILNIISYANIENLINKETNIKANTIAYQIALTLFDLANIYNADFDYRIELPKDLTMYMSVSPSLISFIVVSIIKDIQTGSKIKNIHLTINKESIRINLEVNSKIIVNTSSDIINSILQATSIDVEYKTTEKNGSFAIDIEIQLPAEEIIEHEESSSIPNIVLFSKEEKISEKYQNEAINLIFIENDQEAFQNILNQIQEGHTSIAITQEDHADLKIGLLLIGFCSVCSSIEDAIEKLRSYGLISVSSNRKMADFVDAELKLEYLKYLKENLPKIVEAIQNKDTETLRLLTHKLKSNAPIFGFSKLGELAAQVEQDCKQGTITEYSEFKQLINETLNEIGEVSNNE